MFEKFLILFLISSVKFVFAFPLAIGYKFSLIQTILITTAGGISGVLFFAFISKELMVFYRWFVHKYLIQFPRIHRFAKGLKNQYHKVFPRKQKKVFSKQSKRFVRIKQNYGLVGIALLTPLILSIPIGTFLAIRFFGPGKKTFLFLLVAVLLWSLTFSLLIHLTELRY